MLFTLAAVFMGCRRVPAPSTAQTFPVICTEAIPATNRINLEQLKDVPVPGIIKFGGLKFINDVGTEVTVTTWRELTRCRKEGYWEKTTADNVMSGWSWLTRGYIPFLEKAVPATNSFVRSLRPGKALVRLLPLILAPLLGEESNDVANAIKRDKAWLEFYPTTKIIKRTDTEMSLQMGRYEVSVTILAYGDFNHEGFDDMLVFYDQNVTDGTFAFSGVAVLTRTTPDGR
jgi:hypothetical protein